MAGRPRANESRGSSDLADEDAKQRFLDLASRRILNLGYAVTSIRDLAAIGDISVYSIYRHFHSKAELLSAVINRRYEHDVPPAVGQDSFRGYVAGSARTFSYRAAIRALIIEGASEARRDSTARRVLSDGQRGAMERVVRLCHEAQAHGELVSDFEPHDLVSLLWAAEYGFGILEAFGIGTGDPEDRALLSSLLIDCVANQQPPP